jgi:hypothetical protein
VLFVTVQQWAEEKQVHQDRLFVTLLDFYHKEMIQLLSNQRLLESKLKDLQKFTEILFPSNFPYQISCNYHGINLQFKIKSEKFIQSLKKLIPNDWICDSTNGNVIYLMTPEEFDHSPETWSNESSQDCITFENNNIAIQRDFASQINKNEVLLICEDSVGDGFYNFLRWFLSEKLLDINKYVVHASCVLDKNNYAHLFLGHSGAGKTTITQLSNPRLVLGDDMNVINLQNNQLYVEAGAIGGLFNSMIGYDKKVPVKACYWLKQDSNNVRIPLGIMTANQKLLASFANLHWSTLPQNKIDQLMKFSIEATSTTKFYELSFINSSAIWELLDP